jgi:hypothetical protein
LKVQDLSEKYPEAEVWTFDEHRLGLKPIKRRVWSLRGFPLTAPVNHRYQWLYVYGYVNPQSGRTHWHIISTVNTEAFNASLSDFAQSVGASKDKPIVLVIDRAGWHRSQHLIVPEGIVIEYLPAYSPELQPAERLWPLVNEAVANECFDTLKDLWEKVCERCVKLCDMLEEVKGIALYNWWPTVYSYKVIT